MLHDATEGTRSKALLHGEQLPAEKVPGMYPSAHTAEVQSSAVLPVHAVHADTECSKAKSLQQNPDGMNVEYPDAQVAAVHSAVLEPLHSVHTSIEASVAKSLQQNPPVMNVENPAAHVACKHSVGSPPVQSTQDP